MTGERMVDAIRNAYITALRYPNEWAVSQIQKAFDITDERRRHAVMWDICRGAEECWYD